MIIINFWKFLRRKLESSSGHRCKPINPTENNTTSDRETTSSVLWKLLRNKQKETCSLGMVTVNWMKDLFVRHAMEIINRSLWLFYLFEILWRIQIVSKSAFMWSFSLKFKIKTVDSSFCAVWDVQEVQILRRDSSPGWNRPWEADGCLKGPGVLALPELHPLTLPTLGHHILL